jgi:quinol monooxygenase YgiN
MRSVADRYRSARTRANIMDNSANQSLVVTAFWQANPGEEAAIAGLLKEFLPQAQREPGVKEFQIHQNTIKPNEFFFYEVFAGEAAFADHQQTRHFMDIIVGQADPEACKTRARAVPVYLDCKHVASNSSCPGLSRASTSLKRRSKNNVDGRDKPGHDEESA